MQFLGRGNANICFQDELKAYRLCVKYSSVSANNKFTQNNYEFIKNKIMGFKKLCKYICPMDVESVYLNEEWCKILVEEGIEIDERNALLIVMPVLRKSSDRTIILDHFNKLHVSEEGNICWEFKPKWLFQTTFYCRNCTHNRFKGREIRYCFSDDTDTIMKELFVEKNVVPEKYIEHVTKYLNSSDSILSLLYCAQREAREDLSLLMTLRDVTCFLIWSQFDQIKVRIVDLDLKPTEKRSHWENISKELELYPDKKPSHSRFH